MRVMVIGPQGPDDFADNVRDTLLRMGHDVIVAGPARPPTRISKLTTLISLVSDHTEALDVRRQRHLVRLVRNARPDVLLTTDRRLHRSVVQAAREIGARTALWFPDSVATMGRHDMFFAGYDRIYFKNPLLVDRLQKIYGLPVHYMPEACNSIWHRSSASYGQDESVIIAGNIHPTRAALVHRLLDAGLPVRLFGNPISNWVNTPALQAAHTGQYLSRHAKADSFRHARVVLNNLHPAEYAGINCRVFEAAGSGALVLTEPRAGLDELYETGQELEVFESFGELEEKLRWYLAKPSQGQTIADRGAWRSHAEHTYEHRLADILEDLT